MNLNVDFSEKNHFTVSPEKYKPEENSMIPVAASPVFFENTNVLIQPCGLINNNGTETMDNPDFQLSGKRNQQDAEFFVEGIIENTLSGRMSNLYFDDMSTNKKRMLTDKNVYIYNVTYLRGIAEKTNKHYLMYSVYDKDTNNDGRIDEKDIVSMYVSRLDGSNFRKLTPDDHEFLGGKIILPAKRCYYTTLEHTNTTKEKFNYYYIDFSSDPYKVVQYVPVIN